MYLVCFVVPAGAGKLRQVEPDLLARSVPPARVWHERRVAIVGTREDSGLAFGSDLTGKSASP